MTFFRPTRHFVRWLLVYANGRLIVDVGCGEGELLSRIFQMGGDAAGVEPRWGEYHAEYSVFDFHVGGRKLSSEIAIRMVPRVLSLPAPNAITQAPNALLVLARPSHDGWVEDVICAADPTSEVLYISKPENVDRDLWFPCSVAELNAPACREGERVYRVTPDPRVRNAKRPPVSLLQVARSLSLHEERGTGSLEP